MTNTEFLMYWGACLATMVGFAIWMGVLTMKQKKADRQRAQESEMRMETYLKAQAQKKLWDSNFAESEKLFEKKGGAKK